MVNVEIFKTPEEAKLAGFIPIDEAIKIRPGDHSNYVKQCKKGVFKACQVYKGARLVWYVALSSLREGKKEKLSYEELRDDWLSQMRSGAFTGKPSSQKYVKNILKWGLHRYWTILDKDPSIEALNAENFRKVMDSKNFEIDEINRIDFYSTRMHIYRACTRFTDFLIQRDLKTNADRVAYKLPKRLFKPQKRMLEEEQIQEVLDFNKSWRNGRSDYDVEITDVLIHLYAFAGLRRIEPASLKLHEINYETNLMLVYRKGGKEGYVPINLFPALKQRLSTWVEYSRPNFKSDLLLLQKNGKPLTEGSIKDRFLSLSNALNYSKAYKKLSLSPGWMALSNKDRREQAEKLSKTMKNIACPHDFRRTFATIMAKRGMPMTMIQLILGHADLSTTQGYVLTNIRHVMDWTASQGLVNHQEKKIAPGSEEQMEELLFQAFAKMT